MPIRHEHRFFYPIDWPQLSAAIRFGRAGGVCEGCGRPHGQRIYCLGDGQWWDASAGTWRDGQGRRLPDAPSLQDLAAMRVTKVALATAHRDHDTSNNAAANLAAFCQRCRMKTTDLSIGEGSGAHCSSAERSETYSADHTAEPFSKLGSPLSGRGTAFAMTTEPMPSRITRGAGFDKAPRRMWRPIEAALRP